MPLSRRQFLLRSAVASGAAAASTLPIAGCAPDLGPAPTVDVAPPVGEVLTVPLSAAPQLRQEGGAVIVRAPGVEPILVLQVAGSTGSYAATAATCTHLGCPLGVEGEEIVCPCHLSRFGLDGKVRKAPATADLAVYGAEFVLAEQSIKVNLAAGDPGFPTVANGQVVFLFSAFPALAAPGGSVVGKPAGAREPIAVMALAGGLYKAVDATCTHLGCRVAFNATAVRLDCPCHGSQFGTDGSVVQSPATRPLRALVASADANGVTVTFPA